MPWEGRSRNSARSQQSEHKNTDPNDQEAANQRHQGADRSLKNCNRTPTQIVRKRIERPLPGQLFRLAPPITSPFSPLPVPYLAWSFFAALN
jgi:hypothetical protein